MLLDLRVVLAAILATVLLLMAGFSLIAGVRAPLKPSIGFSISGPPAAQALNPPPAKAKPMPLPLPVRERAPEVTGTVSEKPVTDSAPEPAPAKKKSVNLVPHEESTLTDDDKKAAKPAAAAKPKQNVKAKKKVRAVAKPAPAKSTSPFSLNQ